VQKHGVRFEDAATIFGDAFALTVYDSAHSVAEDRWLTIGHTATGALLVVAHNAESGAGGETRIRLISARPATPRERRYHQEQPR
jgi:uncharacterized DUF497 family protein